MKSLKQQEDIILASAATGLFCLIAGALLSGCGNQIGDSASDDDVSTNIITTITSSEQNEEACPNSSDVRWKAVSESDGNLVVLFPMGFHFNLVEAETLEGDFETGVDVGLTNGSRQTIRFSMPGDEYTGVLLADECEYLVKQELDEEED